MSESVIPHRRQQEAVNAYFQSQSLFWKDIYASGGVYAEIHRGRHTAVLAWIDGLALAPGSPALEIGCGAGFMAIALAQSGLCVQAIDATEAMVEQARRHAAESGTTDLLSVDVGDVYALAFEDESFELVLAIGVIPWLGQVELAIQEMVRVTRPGGYIIFTADNRARLNLLLDPWMNPALAPLRRRVKAVLEVVGLRRRSSEETGTTLHNFHDRRFIDEILANTQLVKTKGMTLGFGPFSLQGRKVLPEALSIALHHLLQRLADWNIPGFRSTGAQYLVLARKSVSQPRVQSTNSEQPISDTTE
jgi:ubiquinone/menaquinone biosynthesis C-methylase UbiE